MFNPRLHSELARRSDSVMPSRHARVAQSRAYTSVIIKNDGLIFLIFSFFHSVPDDSAEIEEAEAKLAHALKAEKDTIVLETKRKKRKTAALGVASPNKVARSLGEKPVLTQAQKEVKKQALDAKKKLKEVQRKTEEEQDSQVLRSVNRRLAFDKVSTDPSISKSSGESNAASTSKKTSSGTSSASASRKSISESAASAPKSSSSPSTPLISKKSTNGPRLAVASNVSSGPSHAVVSKPSSGDAVSDEDIVDNEREDSGPEMDDDGSSSEDDNNESDPDLRLLSKF